MNLILLFKSDFIKGKDKVLLTGRRFEHVKNVLKIKEGDSLCVGLINSKMGCGKVTHFDQNRLEMDVVLDKNPPTPLYINLILALPRPIVLNRLLASITSMGVKKIFLIATHRVEKSYWKSPVLKEQNINEQLMLGLEQAKDTLMPEVYLKPRLNLFIKDDLPSLIIGTKPILAHPDSTKSLSKNIKSPATLLIGPEGGFIPSEVDQFSRLGFHPYTLGPRILRVETAVSVLLSKLS